MQKDRKNALLKMLPPWTGFVVGEHSEEMSPSEALEKFRNTVTCFTQVWVEEQGSPRRSKPSLNLDEVRDFVHYLFSLQMNDIIINLY